MTKVSTNNTTISCTIRISSEYSQHQQLFPFFVSVNVLLFLLSVAGNSLLLFVIHKKAWLRTTSNLLMCSLATTDLITGLIAIPLNIIVERLWVNTELDSLKVLNKVQTFFVYFATSGSTLNVCVMSIDRYIAVTWPLRYVTIMTTPRLIATLMVCWLMNIFFSLIGLFSGLFSKYTQLFQLARLTLLLVIPLVTMFYCYVKIFWISNKHLKYNSQVHPALEMSSTERNFPQRLSDAIKNKKSSITLAIITVVFLISFTPCMLLSILSLTAEVCKFRSFIKKYWPWAVVFMYSSCALNPLVYGARSTEIREAVKTMLSFTSTQNSEQKASNP